MILAILKVAEVKKMAAAKALSRLSVPEDQIRRNIDRGAKGLVRVLIGKQVVPVTVPSLQSAERDPRFNPYKLQAASVLPEFEKLPRPRRAFLRGFAETLSIGESARRIGYDKDTHYYWLRHDKLYAKCFKAVRAIAVQRLEDEAVRRAKDGVLVPVVSAGKLVTYERKYNSSLMITLLQRFNPGAYK